MKFYTNFDTADLIALVVILGYLGLTALGKTSDIQPAFLIVIGYYFGHRAANKRNNESTA